ncbi:uncharacterized protein [Drosophila kikkawai]|uniref:Uncharacterized protein n=1 Tax=Drosophila kikkawai TaxID=30033 RepID=A0ABM3C7Q5_DROKI|nr:uncharacterized protein LOC121502889 [Drosophila kikkawai]XP_041632862.1 uncharacterized protein LOC121502889 [Drosophila kikkawai]XP_041632863.1 uncharacterized protein LOC121502889 [Drosophila kikkawai]XP_041632864.1 uncharacterized protein LOC121502889 [Drosophila kikkawai]XP_041632865.1 uncharacterized protein LOC121502889 [Drosophila kikkawai]
MKTKNRININSNKCNCFSHSSQGIAITDEKNVLRIQSYSYTYKCLNHNPRPRILG